MISPDPPFSMKFVTSAPVILSILLVVTFLVLPAAGAYATTAPAATQAKLFVSATVSAASITAGQPVTVSGTAPGDVIPGIQIWIFAEKNRRYSGQSCAEITPLLFFCTNRF